MTVALYLRLSSEDNDGVSESESISNQRNLLLHHVNNTPAFSGANVVEFCDDGWSGKNFDRPAIKELLEQTKRGEIQCIMVKDDCVILGLNSESPENTGLCDVSSVF